MNKFLIAICASLLPFISNADDLALWLCRGNDLNMFLVVDPDDGQFTIFNVEGTYMGASKFEIANDNGRSFYHSKVDYTIEDGTKKTMLVVGDMNLINHTLSLAMQDNANAEANKVSPILIMRCK